MKKLVTLLLFGAFALSCTDKAYDLSQIETGDVAIGNDDSEFRMPLLTVFEPMADLAADGKEIQAIFDEADIWLPTAATAVDLVRLDSDPDYRTQLIAATVAEMHTSDAKLKAVIALSFEQYYACFAPVLGLDPAHPDLIAYAAAFGRIFASEELAGELEAAGIEVALDARDERAGVKFADADLIGWPYQLIVGKRGAQNDVVEFKDRATGDKVELDVSAAVSHVIRVVRGALEALEPVTTSI